MTTTPVLEPAPVRAEVFTRAADLVAEKGLWQAGVAGTSRGTCVWLAVGQAWEELNAAQVFRGKNDEALRGYLEILASHLGVEPVLRVVFRWSDTLRRTPEEVEAVLRACAASVE